MSAQANLAPYAAILLVIGLAVTIAGGMLLVAHLVRPARKGPVKDSPYESGMPVIGDARGRFNVRFYIVALLFLLFDVEVVFLWPWAPIFYRSAMGDEVLRTASGDPLGAGYLLGVMVVFLAILLVGYAYAWRKGVLEWD